MAQERYGIQNEIVEWAYVSTTAYSDPCNDVDFDVVFTVPEGDDLRVPAFWAGGHEWRIRFAPPLPGTYRYRAVCSDTRNSGLHGLEGTLHVSPYEGDNMLLRRGPLRVSQNHCHLEHRDGTPFFWLGDTWWLGLSRRLAWPADLQRLTADRVTKGFTVIQLVAGLYPDMDDQDARGENEAGHAWMRGFGAINTAFFDMADLRIQWLVRAGLVPCILGSWGYYLRWMGVDKMKRHWRNLVARYGAYPVVWCLAGETTMPFYLSARTDRADEERFLRDDWTTLARYLRQVDPYHHPITLHPPSFGGARDQVEDETLVDLDMLQGGQNGASEAGASVEHVAAAVARAPRLPVINGEACYEGIMERSRAETQRALFWGTLLSGAAGHTYGANGLWQVNTRDHSFGASPHGASWGDTPWEDAYRLPGSAQVGVGKRVLEGYDWWRFEPHPEWVEIAQGRREPDLRPCAAGIPGEVRVCYFPDPLTPWAPPATIVKLEPEDSYAAAFVDPRDGRRYPLGPVEPDDAGRWPVPTAPRMQDWVLVLEKTP